MNVADVRCPDCRRLIAWRHPNATELSLQQLSFMHWTHRPIHPSEVSAKNFDAARAAWAEWARLDPTEDPA